MHRGILADMIGNMIRTLMGVILCISTLVGQTVDTTRTDVNQTFAVMDTLQAYDGQTPVLSWSRMRTVGLGIMLVSTGLALATGEAADKAYDDYLASGDPAALPGLFDEVERLDRLTGMSYVGVQVGFLLLMMSFDEVEAERLVPIEDRP